MRLRIAAFTISALVASAALSACASGPAESRASAQSAEADAILAEYQATGETRTCVPVRSIDQIDPLDESRWLVTLRNGETYLNEVSRGCSQAASDFTYLQYSISTGSLCSIDIVRVLDRGTDTVAGSCALNEFQALERINDTD
jgi:hypothetical protein